MKAWAGKGTLCWRGRNWPIKHINVYKMHGNDAKIKQQLMSSKAIYVIKKSDLGREKIACSGV
jgi:hypothetical protein